MRMVLGVEVKLAAGQRHEPLRVGLVVDRERGRVAEPAGLAAQEPHARRVERHHPHAARTRSGQCGRPGRHLTRGLVGERDRQDLPRADPALRHEVSHPAGQHPGLARACSGHDEQRAALVHNGGALLWVQVFEKSIDGGDGHVPRVGGGADAPEAAARCRFAHAAGPRPGRARTPAGLTPGAAGLTARRRQLTGQDTAGPPALCRRARGDSSGQASGSGTRVGVARVSVSLRKNAGLVIRM